MTTLQKKHGAPVPASDVYALVDFDNLLPPYEDCTREAFGLIINQLLDAILHSIPTAERVSIRLYGGWMSNGVLSRRGSDVSAAVSGIRLFPRISIGSHRVRGDVLLATALLAQPAVSFSDTARRRNSVPRLRLSGNPLPAGCAVTSEQCPAKILQKFTSKNSKECPVDECMVLCRDAFVVQEQKMVDGMLICDLITLTDEQPSPSCVIVSDDTDFVPALIIGGYRSEKVFWGLRDLDLAASHAASLPESVSLIKVAEVA